MKKVKQTRLYRVVMRLKIPILLALFSLVFVNMGEKFTMGYFYTRVIVIALQSIALGWVIVDYFLSLTSKYSLDTSVMTIKVNLKDIPTSVKKMEQVFSKKIMTKREWYKYRKKTTHDIRKQVLVEKYKQANLYNQEYLNKRYDRNKLFSDPKNIHRVIDMTQILTEQMGQPHDLDNLYKNKITIEPLWTVYADNMTIKECLELGIYVPQKYTKD